MLAMPLLCQILNVGSVLEGPKECFLTRGVRTEGLCNPRFFLIWAQIFIVALTIGLSPVGIAGRGKWEHKADRKEKGEAALSRVIQMGEESVMSPIQ